MRIALLKPLISGVVSFLVAAPFAAHASIQFTGSGDGSSTGNLAASALFDVVGGDLHVTLTNTATTAIAEPQDVLLGLTFKLVGVTDLTPAATNAATASGILVYTSNANIIQNPAVSGPGYLDVSGEWAYVESASAGVGSFALGGAGRGVWGSGDIMTGADRDGGSTPPDGMDFGIVSASTTLSSGSNGFKNGGPYVQNSILFDLGSVPSEFNPTAFNVTDVVFLYGTSTSEPDFPGVPIDPQGGEVPEPLSLLVWSGLAIAFTLKRA